MQSSKVKYMTMLLMAVLVIVWGQPLVAQACLVTLSDATATVLAPKTAEMGCKQDTAEPAKMGCKQDTAEPAKMGCEQDTANSLHTNTAQTELAEQDLCHAGASNTFAKSCTMKSCCQPFPPTVSSWETSTTAPEYIAPIARYSGPCISSLHISKLYRPPRLI